MYGKHVELLTTLGLFLESNNKHFYKFGDVVDSHVK